MCDSPKVQWINVLTEAIHCWVGEDRARVTPLATTTAPTMAKCPPPHNSVPELMNSTPALLIGTGPSLRF